MQGLKSFVTRELQDLLVKNPNIKKIYIDSKGRIYLTAWRLIRFKGDTAPKELYGQGAFSHRQLIPGDFNIDGMTEAIAKGVPDTKIELTLSRDEVLAISTEKRDNSLASQILNSSEQERNAIMASLFPPDVWSKLQDFMKSGGSKDEETENGIPAPLPFLK